ncbi:MAG TPA: GTP cyclohydrolase I, partial [Bacillota bacterium]|nr:GTP cyclohydrolase I [Bacillota bacterium]
MTQENIQIERIKKLLNGTTKEKDDKLAKSYEFMDAVKCLIDVCGDDPERQGLQETPYRVLKAFLEYTEGYHEDPKVHLEKTFDVEHKDIIMVRDIDFNSTCEHH